MEIYRVRLEDFFFLKGCSLFSSSSAWKCKGCYFKPEVWERGGREGEGGGGGRESMQHTIYYLSVYFAS